LPRAYPRSALLALNEQLGDYSEEEEASIFVADSGLYSEANMIRLAEAEGEMGKPGARDLQYGAFDHRSS
jgi:hypothetical protein